MVETSELSYLAGQQNNSEFVGQINGSNPIGASKPNGLNTVNVQNGFHKPDDIGNTADSSSACNGDCQLDESLRVPGQRVSCHRVGHHLNKAKSLDQNSRFEAVLNSSNFKEYWNQAGEDRQWFDDKILLTLILPISMNAGGLARAIKVMEEKSFQIVHMESRPSKKPNFDLDILVQIKLEDGLTGESVVKSINEQGFDVAEFGQSHAMLIPRAGAEDEVYDTCADDEGILSKVPWFPRKISDLDTSSKRVLMYGTDLDADHPGFKDPIYRQRRMLFAEIALNYKQGEPIPRVERTAEEIKTWSTIYKELRKLHKKYACKEYLENFELLEKYCGYGENNIPILNDISNFLRAKTGFQVRPVAGYLSSRDFLAGLAFRVFHCTQYIRHPADPFYSPEPDTCHELLGHMPLFADPDFAQFSQEIGLASLGASEDDVQKLATMYFFTVEFGLCRQEGELKVYGAGLLSSVGELKHAIEEKPEILPFDPDRVIQQECLITSFQTAYFYTESFEEAQQKIRTFVNNMKRPFVLRYDPYTESIEILNNKRSITLAINSLRSDINLLANALHKLL